MLKYKDDLIQVRDILWDGGLILYPTDTIWGIGCDATNTAAIDKIFALKGRPSSKSLILLVDSLEMLHEYAAAVPPKVDALLRVHDRPLTVVYDKATNLPAAAVAENGSVAIRVTRDGFCRDLIQLLGKPLTSTSANVHGTPFPRFFGEVGSDIIEGVDYVVRHRRDDQTPSAPSVIARFKDSDKELEFLRE